MAIQMRVLFFGMRCIFSPPVLAAIVSAGHEVVAVITPGPAGAPPLTWSRRPGARPGISLAPEQDGLDGIAARRQLPIGQIASIDDTAAVETLAALRPEIIVVACFPRLLPDALLSIVPHGGFNLHPSLLPSLRGPEPLFWALRNGLEETGVTAHRLTDHFDAGEIYAQEQVAIPFGARIGEIESLLASKAGEMAVDTLPAFAHQTLRPAAQCDSESTYAPFPTMHDFIIPSTWSGRRAFAFVRAVSPLGEPLIVEQLDGAKIAVRDAINWFAGPADFGTDSPAEGEADIRFADGIIRFRI
jgi:methionyl-tRNA formyltransferase